MARRMSAPTTGQFTEHINFGLSAELRLRVQKVARDIGEKEGATVRRIVREWVESYEASKREKAS